MLRLALYGLAGLIFFSPLRATAEDYQIIDVPSDLASDVFYQFNTKGTVYLKIIAEEGKEPCAEFWWIKWGFGTIEELGRKCGAFSVAIPTLTDGVISSKLRTSGAPYRLKILVTTEESVANSVIMAF